MSQSVTIKSNKYGINLVLDPEIGFDELLKDVVEKFKASSTFFKNAKLALSFEGRKLSEEEAQQIISAIESNTSIEILCIVENGTRQEAVMKERNDIVTRATYLCLLACYQVGLSPRTLKRIQDAMTGPVADKYNEYRNDQLADLWAQVTLQSIGIEAPKTKEPL